MNSAFSVGVHALVYLNHKKSMLSSEELAENICTNPARVRKIMASLKQAGLVETKEGNEGGYRLLMDPQTVTLAGIADALDVCFVEVAWRSGDSTMDCLVASGMANLMDGIFAELDQKCKAYLETISIADLERSIFARTKKGVTRDERI